jgi:HEAT repeat protein
MLNNPITADWMGHFAAVALGKIGDKQAFDPLITALSDKDVMIRIAAADGLGYLGDSRALPTLRLARKNDNGIDEFGESVRDHATRAIRRIQRHTKKGL